MNLIEQLEQEEIARLGKTLPDFAPGDTIVVQVKVKEGTRERLQAYEGVVIAKRNRAKLYYLRERSGKSARIKEKLTRKVVVAA